MTEQSRSIQFAKSYHLLQMAMMAAIAIFCLMGSSIVNGYIIDGNGLILGRDFLNMWHYGIAAFSENPAAFYDFEIYNARLDTLVAEYPDQNWSYPPHFMLIAAPFGLFGYNAALALMTGLSILCFWFFVVNDFENATYRKSIWLMPAFLFALICGQLSVLLAAVLIVIYHNIDRRPILTGILIALLTIKPQVGFLFPIFLIATQRWPVLLSATIATVAFVGASILIYGAEIWEVFLFSQVGEQSDLLFQSHPLTRGLMPSLAANFGIMGMGKSAALMLHFGMALIAIAAMVWCCLRSNDKFLQYAVFIATCFVATPYLMAYDTIILCWIAVHLLSRYGANSWQKMSYRFIFALIPIGVALSMLNIPGSSLILMSLVFWALSETGLLSNRAKLQAAE